MRNIIPALLTGFLLLGCGREEPIVTVEKVVKNDEITVAEKTDVKRPFSWKLPDGWKEKEAQGIVTAEFSVPNLKKGRCYMLKLKGDGGGLTANINRWFGQMCIMGVNSEITDELTAASRKYKLNDGHEIMILDFTKYAPDGKSPSMVVGIVTYPDSTLYVKLFGVTDEISGLKEQFIAFAASIRRNN